MIKKIFYWNVFILLEFCFVCTSCVNINTNKNVNFNKDGTYIPDSTSKVFHMKKPSCVKFFVEVSGSMNGFFRSNIPTYFKTDFWKILNFYEEEPQSITILTNSGSEGKNYKLRDFKKSMNTGAFLSTASTRVPEMLQTIINKLDINGGEVAVLVSDMKYSPVGDAAPYVLMEQYITDISHQFRSFDGSAALICAFSDYYDRSGLVVCERAPYYYFILGKQEYVATVRNDISRLLELQGRFVDNIESGFDYGTPKYSFGVCYNCDQLNDEPTFMNYKEAKSNDTCILKLKINLEDYRWIITDEEYFRESLNLETLYGSKVELGQVSIDIKNSIDDNRGLERKVIAIADIKLYNMISDSEVIEWSLNIPFEDYTLFNEFFDGATDENDPSKSYSVLDFIKGFQNGLVSKDLKPNYILISKNGNV